MLELAASFDDQLSPVAPFLFYVVIAGVIFIETGLLIGFFLPGDSLLFSAGLVAAGGLAAAMSTADGLILAMAQVLVVRVVLISL